jgi:hypothetical protein
MIAFRSQWLEWEPTTGPPKNTLETPNQRTDKTDKSPSVSFVSASPRRSEGEFNENGVANLSRPALPPASLVELYPVAPSDEWLADGFYQMRNRARLPDPDDFEERVAIMEYDGELSREQAERLARN